MSSSFYGTFKDQMRPHRLPIFLGIVFVSTLVVSPSTFAVLIFPRPPFPVIKLFSTSISLRVLTSDPWPHTHTTELRSAHVRFNQTRPPKTSTGRFIGFSREINDLTINFYERWNAQSVWTYYTGCLKRSGQSVRYVSLGSSKGK